MGNDCESTHSGEGLGDKSEDEVAQGGGFDVDSDLTGEDFAPSVFTPIVQQKRMGDDSVLGVVSKKKTSSVLVENLLSEIQVVYLVGFLPLICPVIQTMYNHPRR